MSIICAAIRHPSINIIICGADHYDKVMMSALDRLDKDLTREEWEEGFINEKGRFYTRSEAFQIALLNKQLKSPVQNQQLLLYTDDLKR